MNGPNAESIECFAALCAKLDDGGTPRAHVLAAAGIDEPTLVDLRRRWLPLLASGEDATLAVRFAGAYARVRQDLSGAHGGEPKAPGQHDADTERDVAGNAEIVGDVDRTMEMPLIHVGAALPFEAGAAGSTISPFSQRDDHTTGRQPRPPCDPTERTLEVPSGASTAAALPFMPPTPAPTGRRQRLHRFDTQTGRPLATPIWVDEPTPTSPQR